MIGRASRRFFSRYVLAIDQGTTSSRAVLFDSRCKIVDVQQKEHQQITPQPGWVEHNPDEIVANVTECVTTLLARVRNQRRIETKEIACVGVTNQRETTVAWVSACDLVIESSHGTSAAQRDRVAGHADI
jgi:glycerol kinase